MSVVVVAIGILATTSPIYTHYNRLIKVRIRVYEQFSDSHERTEIAMLLHALNANIFTI